MQDVKPAIGSAAIAAAIEALPTYSSISLSGGAVDVQISNGKDILILVTGTLKVATGDVNSFAQTFVLAYAGTQQGGSYYVRNDCLRILNATPSGSVVPPIVATVPAVVQDGAVVRVEEKKEAPAAAVPEPVAPPAPAPVEAPAPAPAAAAEPAPAAPVVEQKEEKEKKSRSPGKTRGPKPAATVDGEPAAASAAVPRAAAEPEQPKGPKTWASVATTTAAAPPPAQPKPAKQQKAVKPAPVATSTPSKATTSKGGDGGAAAGAKSSSRHDHDEGLDVTGARTCFVRGPFNKDTKVEDIISAFSAFGKVTTVKDKYIDKGYVHVHFSSVDEASKAVAAKTVKMNEAATLIITAARPAVTSPTTAAADKPSAARAAPAGDRKEGAAAVAQQQSRGSSGGRRGGGSGAGAGGARQSPAKSRPAENAAAAGGAAPAQ